MTFNQILYITFTVFMLLTSSVFSLIHERVSLSLKTVLKSTLILWFHQLISFLFWKITHSVCFWCCFCCTCHKFFNWYICFWAHKKPLLPILQYVECPRFISSEIFCESKSDVSFIVQIYKWVDQIKLFIYSNVAFLFSQPAVDSRSPAVVPWLLQRVLFRSRSTRILKPFHIFWHF